MNMTLVDRLRAAAPGTMLSMQVNDLAALREAADEIERLRAALESVIDLAAVSVECKEDSDAVKAARAVLLPYQQYGGK